MAKKIRFTSGFTLGGEQAEADPVLEHAFYNSSDFKVISSKSDPRCFLVGRTGSGKSAALQRLQEENVDHTIRINPEDLSLPYITDLQVIKYLGALDVNLDLFWIALWKHVLLVEIIKQRYDINSPQAKDRFLQNLRERLSRDSGKKAALEYLDEFEGRFWCETDERVREIANSFTNQLAGEVGGSAAIPLPIKLSGNYELSREVKTEEADRYQRIVNNTQLSKLNKMIEVLNDQILDDQHFTYIVIDDLDRDWVDERLSNDLIRCLFRSVLDFKRVHNLKILVALRTNIFQELDFGNKSGSQEEKFRSLVLNVKWSRFDLTELLDERTRYVCEQAGEEPRPLQALLPNPNAARGSGVDYILDRTLLRPRDAIAFANECLASSVGKDYISWETIKTAERSYSAKRLLALRDEWKATYPGIDRVVECFRGVNSFISMEQLELKLDEVILLLSDPTFPGVRWLTPLSEAMWTSGSSTRFEIYQPLSLLLYQIGLLGFARGKSRAPIFFSDDERLLEAESTYLALSSAYVHRTYQRALDVRLSEDLLQSR